MKICRLLIVEDEESYVNTLKEYLTRLPFITSADVCHTAGAAFDLLSANTYDMVFLDMGLPDLSGVELIHALPKHPAIIVTTAHPNYAVDCYDLNVVDYLLKPYTYQRFLKAVGRTLNVQFTASGMADSKSIFVKVSRSMHRFTYEEINFIEASGIYSKITHNQRVTLVNETISSLEARLPSQQFMRVHKSYIVNLDSISSYGHTNLVINGSRIPMGASYRSKFESFLNVSDNS